jgi:hypothetical protein
MKEQEKEESGGGGVQQLCGKKDVDQKEEVFACCKGRGGRAVEGIKGSEDVYEE